ncbi:MAG TPA: acyltransferase family protein [Candidatus Limnocylindrales bacterium]
MLLPRIRNRYRQGFRPDIEGLRAVAVIAVVGFHAAVPGMGGGYIGVDAFFVISGFLITGLLLGEIERRGTFSLKDFYARRARRILPAAGVVLAATSVACAFWMSPLRRQDTAFDIIAAALNVGNWRFIALETDYLAAGRAESPLLHYWSLAVEEQFYLVWAPLALIVALLARKLGRSPFPVLALAITALTAGSFLLSLKWTTTNVPLAYLGSPSRAWQFGVGALAALVSPYLGKLLRGAAGRFAGATFALAGALAVVWSIISYTTTTPFPGTAALVPTLGTVVILLAGSGINKRKGPVGVAWLLATPPVRFIGRLSYSWYLWHWPVLIVYEAHFGEQPWTTRAALMLASAVPAWLTMIMVEGPVRLSPRVTSMPWRGLTAGLAAVLLPVGAGLFLNVNAIAALAAANKVVAAPPPGPAPAVGGKAPPPIDDGHLYLAPLPDIKPGPPKPSPKQARTDLPAVGACQVSTGVTVNGKCLLGNAASPERVVLLGDSHAMQWYPALAEVAKQRGWAMEILGKSGCPVHTFELKARNVPQFYKECATWRTRSIDRILASPTKPKLIFVGTMMEKDYTGQPYLDGWDSTLDKLKTVGVPIVYLRDSPYPSKDVPDCVSGMPIGGTKCDLVKADTLYPDGMADLIREGKRPGVHLLDFTNALCPLEKCQVVIDGILVYKDHSHISATASRILGPRMEKQLLGLSLIEPVT